MFADCSRRLRHGVVLAAVALLLPTAALADPPGEDDIAASRASEVATAVRIASLERSLADLAARAERAGVDAAIANEAYLEAQVALEAAQEEAMVAQRAAAAAAANLEDARSALGAVAQTIYQSGSGSLNALTPYLTTKTFENAIAQSMYMAQLGVRTNERLQRFAAMETVSGVLQRRAAAALAAEEDAAAALELAAQQAQSRADAAELQLQLSTEQRAMLIAQLAAQRQTTVALEQQRQAALEEARRERENAAAQRAAEAIVATAAPTAVAPDARTAGTSRDTERQEPTPVPAPAPAVPTPAPTTSAPAPAPTTPAPAPAPTMPAPAPTTPAPAPTTPAPAPTTPAPAPTTPAPAPTTPAPAPTTPAPAPTTPAPAPVPAILPAAQVALNFALAQVGKPYVWGADGPDSYDCSGLTMASYLAAGINIGRTTKIQYANTAHIPLAQMQPGDLIFYSSDGTAAGIYHVAMYTGNGMRVHAPSPGKLVEHVKMYYGNIMPYAGRVTR